MIVAAEEPKQTAGNRKFKGKGQGRKKFFLGNQGNAGKTRKAEITYFKCLIKGNMTNETRIQR